MSIINAEKLVLQFSFSNVAVVPPTVRATKFHKETEQERTARKANITGTMTIEPTEGCSLVEFVTKLDELGFVLTNALYMERIHGGNNKAVRTYHMVRFVFTKNESDMTDEFKKVQKTVLSELTEICSAAIWRVRSYLNPLFNQEGEVIEGKKAVSVNAEVRQPLSNPDGTKVKVWKKDDRGNRVEQVELKPNKKLTVQAGMPALASV